MGTSLVFYRKSMFYFGSRLYDTSLQLNFSTITECVGFENLVGE